MYSLLSSRRFWWLCGCLACTVLVLTLGVNEPLASSKSYGVQALISSALVLPVLGWLSARGSLQRSWPFKVLLTATLTATFSFILMLLPSIQTYGEREFHLGLCVGLWIGLSLVYFSRDLGATDQNTPTA